MQFPSSPLLVVALLATLGLANPITFEPRATKCTKQQDDLAAGIQKNIDIQNNELSTITSIGEALQKPITDAQWEPMKANFIKIINSGVTQRESNQKIAGNNNAATAGLAKVATAQAGELKLAEALTGKAATDNANVATLKTDFTGGIKQNEQNKKDALGGCVN